MWILPPLNCLFQYFWDFDEVVIRHILIYLYLNKDIYQFLTLKRKWSWNIFPTNSNELSNKDLQTDMLFSLDAHCHANTLSGYGHSLCVHFPHGDRKPWGQTSPLWQSCLDQLNGRLTLLVLKLEYSEGNQLISRKYETCLIKPKNSHTLMVSCRKGPTCHACAWQLGPFWQDTLDIKCGAIKPQSIFSKLPATDIP